MASLTTDGAARAAIIATDAALGRADKSALTAAAPIARGAGRTVTSAPPSTAAKSGTVREHEPKQRADAECLADDHKDSPDHGVPRFAVATLWPGLGTRLLVQARSMKRQQMLETSQVDVQEESDA